MDVKCQELIVEAVLCRQLNTVFCASFSFEKNLAAMAPVSLEDSVPSKARELTTLIVPAIEEERKTTWRHFFWDAWDKTPEERRLIFKVF